MARGIIIFREMETPLEIAYTKKKLHVKWNHNFFKK